MIRRPPRSTLDRSSAASDVYKRQGLDKKTLAETDYHDLILSEYTFLKRPVIMIGEKIFVGNSKNVVQAAVAVAS